MNSMFTSSGPWGVVRIEELSLVLEGPRPAGRSRSPRRPFPGTVVLPRVILTSFVSLILGICHDLSALMLSTDHVGVSSGTGVS